MYCEQCGTKNDEGTKFCTGCGAKLAADGSVEVAGPKEIEINETKPTKKWIKKVLVCIISIAVLASLGTLGYHFVSDNFSNKTDYANHPLVYTKDGSLWLKKNDKKPAFVLTDSYGYYSPYETDEYYMDYSLVQMSEDGKLVFFADDITDGEYKLYYRKTSASIPKGKNTDEKGVKIAAGVTSYTIAPDGSFVIYNKGDRLYYSNLKEDKSIASNVTEFHLSSDLKKVIFRKTGGDLYICGLGAKDEPEKIDAEVSTVISNYNEYQKFYYIKDDSLYVKEYGKEKAKITSDVYNAEMIGDIVYVTKKDETEKKFNDLFNDDCASADAQIEYPSYSDFQVPDEGWGGTRTDYDAYNAAKEKYEAKSYRDRIREYYNENPQTITTYSIYKIVNNEPKKIDENLLDGYIYSHVISKKLNDDSKILLSTVESYSDASSKISNLAANIDKQFSLILNNGNIIKLDGLDAKSTYMNTSVDEKYFYCIEDLDDSYRGTLNRYEISSSGIGAKNKIYNDVSSYSIYGNSIVLYSGDVMGIYESGKYTELSDSTSWNTQYVNGTLYYYDDYSSNKEMGNLMKYKNGKKEQIDIDVHQFVVRDDNLLYYIKDYSTNRDCGELYKRNGSKSEKIDSDVEYMIY